MLDIAAFVAGLLGFITVGKASHDHFRDTRTLIVGGALLLFAVLCLVLERVLPTEHHPDDEEYH